MATTAIAANFLDQKMQSVLHVMGYNLGPHGVDGQKGEDTKFAMRQYALSHGIATNDMAAIAQAITDKLKDPQFCKQMLESLKNAPQNRDNIVATKWLLDAAGHTSLGMKDMATGMMTPKMDRATAYALEHTQGGQVDAAVVTAAVGENNKATRDAILASRGVIPDTSRAFAGAADGTKLASNEPRLQRQPGGPAPTP